MIKLIVTSIILIISLNVKAQHELYFIIPPCPHQTEVLQKKDDKLDFSVFPNPMKTYFVLELTNYVKHGNAEAEIYNILGESVKEIPLTERRTEINVSDFDKGIYILRLRINGDILHEKIIIDN